MNTYGQRDKFETSRQAGPNEAGTATGVAEQKREERQARIDAAFPVFSKWYRGWQSLYDNPFAQYLLLQERRQREKRRGKSWGWRGWLAWGVITCIVLGLAWRYLALPLITAYQLAPVEQAAWVLGVLLITLFLPWYASGIYNTARFCLSVLNRSDLPGEHEYASELLRASHQSDHEILIGLLRLAMPRLLWRVAAAAGMVQLLLLAIFILYSLAGSPGWIKEGVQETLMRVPAALVLEMVCGVLAALAWAAMLMMLGRRRVSSSRVNLEAFSAAAAQVIGMAYCALQNAGGASDCFNFTGSFDLGLISWVAIVALFVVACYLARASSGWRAVLPLALPGVHAGLMLLMLAVSGQSVYFLYQTRMSEIVTALHYCLSAFLIANPAAAKTNAWMSWGGSFGAETFVLLTQLALVPLLLYLARDSIRRYRQAAE